MTSTILTPEAAGALTRALLEFEALNRKRELVNQLVASGLTLEKFRDWLALSRTTELNVSACLTVDIENMLGHIAKGIETTEDSLHRSTPSQVARVVRRAVAGQKARLAA